MNSNNTDVEVKEKSPLQSAEADTCVVCFKNVEIWSIGECDHPVCYECSTRMRVLCQQNECPICRQVLGKVIFTYEKLPYRELETKNRSEYFNKRYKIGFNTNDIQKRFFELLDHPCPKCNTLPYRSFQGLRDHVRREHNLHFCDLCVDHLKIFTFERRCYTQSELNLHRTKGDSDNKSHRGHPLCEYCNKRFLDRDELFRHLRREHYFCHFCDADGCNEFYRDYDALAEHFRQDHYLCEEGKCATEQFVGAFRTEIDYKAHVASVHGRSLNKQQAKQTRTLQLEITLGPRGRGGPAEQNIANMRSRGHDNVNEDLEPSPSYAQYQNQRSITIDSHNEQDFPSLGGGSSAPVQPLVPFQMRRGISAGLARTKENFPALGGGTAGGTSQRALQPQGPPISSMLKKTTTTASNNNARATAGTTSANITNSQNNGSSMVIHVSNRPNNNGGAIAKKQTTPSMDFPALPSTSTSSTTTTAGRGFSNLSLTNKNKKSQQPLQNQQQHQQQLNNNKQQHARLLEEDMLPTSNQNFLLGNVAAKHRTLVDDYVSVANPKNFQKFQLVQQEELLAEQQARNKKSSAPKLTSEEFPTLGGGGGSDQHQHSTNGPSSANWTKSLINERKQRELENRKAKIAPPPLANKNVQSNKSTTNASKENQNSKDNKKLKDKKNEKSNNQNQNDQNSTKIQSKLKEKNNNENKANSNSTSKITNNSFPNVNESSLDSSAQVRPPPGFINNKSNDPLSDNQQEEPNALGQLKQPPPGFLSNVTVNSVAKSPNNLTFTSSLGESYSIVPPKHNYSEPPNSPTRNQKLVKDFQDAMDGYECFKEFHIISQKYREGLYKPEAFYEHCQVALKDKFDELFPELLALLPDIRKQQALYLVHAQRLNSIQVEAKKSLPQLMVCSVCGQIVLSKDTKAHETSHEFPSLKGGPGKPMTAGKRK